MDTKPPIKDRSDIDRFIRAFYEKVIIDPMIGIIFTDIVPLDWEHHIPRITDFWETILLDHPVYSANAMQVHYGINRIFPLEKKHFDTWLSLFNATIDSLYSGEKAELAKKRAAGIAALMQLKMKESR